MLKAYITGLILATGITLAWICATPAPVELRGIESPQMGKIIGRDSIVYQPIKRLPIIRADTVYSIKFSDGDTVTGKF